MTSVTSPSVSSSSLRAVVIRANGTREDLGQISFWHRNPLKRIAFRIIKLLEGYIKQ